MLLDSPLRPRLNNLLGAASGQNGVALAEGDPGLLRAGGSKKGLQAFAQRTASSVVVLHRLVLDLLGGDYRRVVILTAFSRTCVKD